MPIDRFASFSDEPSHFGTRGRLVTPSDLEDLEEVAKAVITATAGNLVIIPAGNADDQPLTFNDIPAGFLPPYRVRRVKATGTTATVYTVD